MRNFQDTFETCKRSFIATFSICMTVHLTFKNSTFLYISFYCFLEKERGAPIIALQFAIRGLDLGCKLNVFRRRPGSLMYVQFTLLIKLIAYKKTKWRSSMIQIIFQNSTVFRKWNLRKESYSKLVIPLYQNCYIVIC